MLSSYHPTVQVHYNTDFPRKKKRGNLLRTSVRTPTNLCVEIEEEEEEEMLASLRFALARHRDLVT